MNTKKNAKKVPAIRFAGFNDDWEQRKLDDVSNFSKGSGFSKGDLRKDGQPVILYGRMYTRYETVIKDVDTFVAPDSKGVFSQGGEVIVPGSGESAEDISRASVVTNSGVLLGGDINIIEPGSELNSEFLALSISNGQQRKELVKRAQGKSVVHLHNSDLQKVVLKIPSKDEQRKISKFIEKIEFAIVLHQRKLAVLKKLKRGYLQKMFPKQGKSIPVLRFAEFDQNWEQRKLGDLVDINTGNRNHQDSVINGKYDFYVRSEKIEHLNEYDFDEEAILVPGDGRIGQIFHYVNGKFALHQRVYKVDNFNLLYPKFLLQLFNKSFREHALKENAQGTVPSLRKPVFTNWIITIPKIEEQTKIGTFFKQLDDTIALHQRKLTSLQKQNKSFLQKMFI